MKKPRVKQGLQIKNKTGYASDTVVLFDGKPISDILAVSINIEAGSLVSADITADFENLISRTFHVSDFDVEVGGGFTVKLDKVREANDLLKSMGFNMEIVPVSKPFSVGSGWARDNDQDGDPFEDFDYQNDQS